MVRRDYIWFGESFSAGYQSTLDVRLFIVPMHADRIQFIATRVMLAAYPPL